MKPTFFLAGLVMATFALPAASADDTITVHLRIDASVTFPFNEPAYVSECDVDLDPAFSSGGDVLDAASCVETWDFVEFGFGRFVTEIDGTRQRNLDNPCPGIVGYWSFLVNGRYSDVGIDDYGASNGDGIEFDYTIDEGCLFPISLASFFVTPVDPDSPVPLQGPL